jgi:hypothetical protein
MVFSSRMVSEVVQPFWSALQRGEFTAIFAPWHSFGASRTPRQRPVWALILPDLTAAASA